VTVGESGVIAAPIVACMGLVYDRALGAGTLALPPLPPPQPATPNSDANPQSNTAATVKTLMNILQTKRP
jgi:hypothetical protein